MKIANTWKLETFTFISVVDPRALTGYWNDEFSRDTAYLNTVSPELKNQKRFLRNEDGSSSFENV